jgi:ABC-type transporter Mla MlaB component
LQLLKIRKLLTNLSGYTKDPINEMEKNSFVNRCNFDVRKTNTMRTENLHGSEAHKGVSTNNVRQLEDQNIRTEELPGVFCAGVQYYDLKNVLYINNTALASLIDLLKSLLKQGKELHLVNVNKSIRKRIKALGLDNVLNCS